MTRPSAVGAFGDDRRSRSAVLFRRGRWKLRVV
jgi:hypothetical protein